MKHAILPLIVWYTAWAVQGTTLDIVVALLVVILLRALVM